MNVKAVFRIAYSNLKLQVEHKICFIWFQDQDDPGELSPEELEGDDCEIFFPRDPEEVLSQPELILRGEVREFVRQEQYLAKPVQLQTLTQDPDQNGNQKVVSQDDCDNSTRSEPKQKLQNDQDQAHIDEESNGEDLNEATAESESGKSELKRKKSKKSKKYS